MATAQLSPRSSALAYRIWAVANPRGWDLTLRELADELGESFDRVRSICMHAGWAGRLRVTSPEIAIGGMWSLGNRAAHADFGVGEIA